MSESKRKPYITILLVIANIIIFLILSFRGMTEDAEYMLQNGAMYVPYLLEQGEYYRIFSSIFLHFGFEHLMNNMVILLFVGWNVELELGRFRFLVLYFLSGLAGNVISGVWECYKGDFSVSAGASGAIFGVIGVLLYMLLKNRGHVGEISGRGVLLSIGLTLYYGYVNTDIDNAAHIGGLIAGFLLGLLLYRKRKRKGSTLVWDGGNR